MVLEEQLVCAMECEYEPPKKDSGEDDATLKEMLRVEEQFVPLLNLIEQLSPDEDGIQFHKKLRYFETTVMNMCPDEARLQQAFGTLRAAALLSPVTARKLAAVGACFKHSQQPRQLLRAALLNVVMQDTFSKMDVLQRSNPQFLINAANLMGDYFKVARLCNGNKVHILASPLLQYMRALLACDDIRAHQSLATQLMQNGCELLLVRAQEVEELSKSIRLRFFSSPSVKTIWLSLAVDLCLNKFLPLSNALQLFYAAQIKLTTDENFNEIIYGSWKHYPEKQKFRPGLAPDSAEKISKNLSHLRSQYNNDNSNSKLKPVSETGTGSLRQKQAISVSQDYFDIWRTKINLKKRYDLNSWRQQLNYDEEMKDLE